MGERRRYRKRADQFVVAVRLDLEGAGFRYRKWGGEQQYKAGDWVVDNDGEVYTVDAESFARTYRRVGPGHYVKTAPVWAERAVADGFVATKEGRSAYRIGDYLVSNQPDGGDAYCVAADRFEAMYESDE